MVKFLQNKIAESKLLLPATTLYGAVVWLLGGLATNLWWLQFICFLLAVFLMAEMNNINALIRIYSRTVSSTFILLSCTACFLFPSLRGTAMEVCYIGALIPLFMTYQDKESTGLTYYAYLLFGIGTLAHVHLVFFLPLLWLLTAVLLQSLSWRTWGASLLGLITPYWVGSCWLVWQQDFTPLVTHFTRLAEFSSQIGTGSLTTGQTAVYALTLLFAVTGVIHLLRNHRNDKIRIRLIYVFFAWTDCFAAIFLLLQPQHYDMLMPLLFINTAPLTAHFATFTATRWTNAWFIAMVTAAFFLTVYNLWTTSSLF